VASRLLTRWGRIWAAAGSLQAPDGKTDHIHVFGAEFFRGIETSRVVMR
jgi:hypothetical protein